MASFCAGLLLLCAADGRSTARADPPGPPLEYLGSSVAQRPLARPEGRGDPDRRCTSDGAHCIAVSRYTKDVCRTIEAAAAEAGLDAGFFARLIWRESLFNASAVSPAGAQGIAQFMPGTARLRRLRDPFNPASALRASAIYLAELRDRYGNIGLAAAAYNAGEARLEDFLFRNRILPLETRAYVYAITGFTGRLWRDAPPEDWDLRLSADVPFQVACEAMAASQTFDGFHDPAAGPWAVIVAADHDRSIAETRLSGAQEKSTLIQAQEVAVVRMKLPARHGTQWTAQVARNSRAEADTLCGQLRKSGVGCIVLRN